MRKPTTDANATPVRVAVVTLDQHLSRTLAKAEARLRERLPGLTITLHAAGTWHDNPAALEAAKADVARADIVIATMLFLDEHISAILPTLKARREKCDAMVAFMAAGDVIKLTRLGRFDMNGQQSPAIRMLKRLKGSSKSGHSSGAKQLKTLRRLPKILKYIPGTAQDVRAYFIAMQYWLAGSEGNIASLVAFLVERYASGPRATLTEGLTVAPPVEYPDVGLYHPRLKGTIGTDGAAVRTLAAKGTRGTVGLLLMRAYVLSGDRAHYDGVIAALEAQGLAVVPAFAAGLDNRPAIDAYFRDANGKATVDAIVSLTGFSLVGGPAYNDSGAAGDTLAELGVPYHVCQPLEFQSVESWQSGRWGLLPVEATMMVAIPELDGATNPQVFGGRSAITNEMVVHSERAGRLAERVAKQIALAKTARAERRLAIVIFNFPPNSGAVGSAAFLSVFASLHNTLRSLKEAGYAVDVPESVDALRSAILEGNAARYGAQANVAHRIPAAEHVANETHLAEIEATWGPAPGRHQSDGATIHVLGREFGNVFVGVQPAFGIEGDPMRLLFEGNFAPTHAFAAFYRHLRENFDAVLHFGTHGALEFMPGKHVGLSAQCWPDRLIGALPNVNLYAANNPSEGLLAKRRAAATLVGHLTPAVTQAGLYKGLASFKGTLEHWCRVDREERTAELLETIRAEADALDLAPESWDDADVAVDALRAKVLECEYALIPHGLHVLGEALSAEARADLLAAMAEARGAPELADDARQIALRPAVQTEAARKPKPGAQCSPETPFAEAGGLTDVLAELTAADAHLRDPVEMASLIAALDGGFVAPGPSGDLIRTPDMLPTGRNIHGFDPFRLPTAFAMADGAAQAERIIARQLAETGSVPETIALVLWGTDNLKSEGAPIAQALALMGARPRLDAYGRLAGAVLIPLAELGRPRIDVVVTLSGIFRDLLPLQTRLLAEAAHLAAAADEPLELNAVRRHALAYAAEHGTDLAQASLRVFSNAAGAYGSNVNQLIDAGSWQDEDELADMFTRRKGFAYGVSGAPEAQPALLNSMLRDVSAAHQNLESVELGITTIDHYFDTLGGISRAVARAKGGERVPVYISDQTRGDAKVRTLDEQVSLETRTRALNPKWTEGMLSHGYEGVRQIEASVTNTMGWSATTGQVQPWVYQRLTETYVLDEAMRDRLTALNPTATAKVAGRLIEAHERRYWEPDAATLAALEAAADEIEDRLEGVAA